MHEIPVGGGKVMRVDDCDYEFVASINWRAFHSRNTWYAQVTSGIYRGLLAHRLILGIFGPIKVDHADRDGLHNERANLRAATASENGRNAKLRKDNSTGLRGVTREKSSYRARIRINGRRLHLGCFPSAQDAALAYDEAATRYHGEFAQFNFPMEGRQ